MASSIPRPESDEYSSFFGKYVSKIGGDLSIDLLSGQLPRLSAILEELTEEESKFRYQSDKWSIRESIGHMIETERVFVYRSLRASRNDSTDLMGFDQDQFVESSSHDEVDIQSHLKEFRALRASTIAFIENLPSSALNNRTSSGGHVLSCRAGLYIIAGHFEHHIPILQDLYISKLRASS